MTTTEVYLIAMLMIFAIPFLVWRVARTEFYAPLVVVQIVIGVVLGPGALGAVFPEYYQFVFNPQVVTALNGVAWWAVMLFVWLAGIELDLQLAWQERRESLLVAGLALCTPLILGSLAGIGLLAWRPEWLGEHGQRWQFVMGVGMGCAVTALPILMLFLEKLHILRLPLGQRLLRYASFDDVAIWGVLALIMLDWDRIGRQACFLVGFLPTAWMVRRLMQRLPEADRWYIALVWLATCSLAADWAGLHYMVGAFLSGVILDMKMFNSQRMDALRENVLLVIMPVFFLSTGLRTRWTVGAETVFIAAGVLLVASIAGKMLGVHLAGQMLRWRRGEARVIGWMLQTKGLIEIVFANVLLDKQIISNETFTALLLMAVASTMLSIPMLRGAPLLRQATAAARMPTPMVEAANGNRAA